MMKDDKMKYDKIKQQLPYSKLVMADQQEKDPSVDTRVIDWLCSHTQEPHKNTIIYMQKIWGRPM